MSTCRRCDADPALLELGLDLLARVDRMAALLKRRCHELERCDREIELMRSQPEQQPAWLVTLGMEDWETEKRLIEREEKR